jgi:methionyl-tRNA formyltransferase
MSSNAGKPALIFMGTPDFAVPTLEHLAGNGFSIRAVVTRPDKPKGRGFEISPSAVKLAAEKAGLPVWQPEDVNTPGFLDEFKRTGAEAVVVAAFGQILKPHLLSAPLLGCVNLHASLLPRYRGAAPIQWAIAHGEAATGITVQKMASRVDSGDVLVQSKLDIGPDETSDLLLARLAVLGGPAVAEALTLLQATQGKAGQPQDEALATFAPRLSREDGKIDWRRPGRDIHNQVRGFFPWPGTFALARGERLKILSTRTSEAPAPAEAPPGTLLRMDHPSGWLVVAGERTTLWVQRVQSANAKPMDSQAFAHGAHFGPGDRLE